MNLKVISVLAAGLLASTSAFAEPITLDFEGATSFASLNNFYNGGTDSAGASGVNNGISFQGDALALSNDELGPYFSNAPSGGSILAPVGPSAALNMAQGFDTSASFYYSSAGDATVSIFSGFDDTGDLLGTFNLFGNAQKGCADTAFCHWDLASISFGGIGHSIQLGSAAGLAGFDNVTVAPVPLPAAIWMLIPGIAGVSAFRRRRKAA